jgi:hypothetical protein
MVAGSMSLQAYIEWTRQQPYYKKWDDGVLTVSHDGDRFRVTAMRAVPFKKGTARRGRVIYAGTMTEALQWAEGYYQLFNHAGISKDIRTHRLALNNGQDSLYVFRLSPNIERQPKRAAVEVPPFKCPVCQRQWEDRDVAFNRCQKCDWPSEETIATHQVLLQSMKYLSIAFAQQPTSKSQTQ